MKLKQKRQRDTWLYQSGDYLAAALAWALFFADRKRELYSSEPWLDSLADLNFWGGVVLIPLAWLLLYSLFDRYRDIYRLSRLSTFFRTLLLSVLGVTLVFFALILDDIVNDYRTYYRSYLLLLLLHFGLSVTLRMLILTWASRRLKAGRVGYATLIVGGNARALEMYRDISGRPKSLGYVVRGYVSTNGRKEPLADHLPQLGKLDELRAVVESFHIEEVLVATEASEQHRLRETVDVLFEYGDKILVKIIPDMYDMLLGNVRMNNVYGAVVIEIRQHLISRAEAIIKRAGDVICSGLALVLLSPLLAYIALRTRISSRGPILFRQTRIGRYGKAFEIIKFRSMYTDAEAAGPQLSSDTDQRITPWGSVMRKWRLDELPQFLNVIRGDMSIVGPRPERKYFIDRIMEHAPQYRHLLKVRPGITSWGQVKYGYASDLDQMLARLRFDILYIENMSLALDMKIVFYTLLVLVQGTGEVTRFALVVTRFALVVTRSALVVTRSALVVTRFALVVTRFALVVTRFALVVTRFALVVTRFALVVTRFALVVTLPLEDGRADVYHSARAMQLRCGAVTHSRNAGRRQAVASQ